MTVPLSQSRNKIMILCTDGANQENSDLPRFRSSSYFCRQVEAFVDDLSALHGLACECRKIAPLNTASAMSSEGWLILRDTIVEAVEIEGFCGVLVLHKADTLTYSAAVMSFLLYGLSAAIVFTGALVAIDVAESDVWDNITGAMLSFVTGVPDGVHLYFHGEMLRPLRATQVKTTGRHPYVEHADIVGPRTIPSLPNSINYRSTMKPASIGVLPLYPGLDSSVLESLFNCGIQALLLEHEGSEWVIDEGSGFSLVESLRKAYFQGIVVVVTSRCMGQSAHVISANLREAGVVSGGYTTREAMLGKLYTLLGSGLSQRRICEFIEHN